MFKQYGHFYDFGPFRLDPAERVLRREGGMIQLAPKAFETLLALVEHHGHVLEKEQMMKLIWPDTFVEEGNLAQHIFTLRKVLGDGQDGQHYIETIPRRGYCFVANVCEETNSHTKPIVKDLSISTTEAGDEISGAVREPARWNPNGRVLAFSLLLVLLAVVPFYLSVSSKSKGTAPIAGVKSLAVLPFKLIGAAKEGDGGDYLGLGTTDVLITRLGNQKSVIVRPTNAIRNYAAPGQDPLVAGRELKVDAVLDGSIQKAGDRIRLTVQLIHVRNGSQLWTEKFDERYIDNFAVQDAISEKVAEALTLRLTGERMKSVRKNYRDNREAHNAYLLGRFFWDKRNSQAIARAVEQFQQAIKLDPDFAPAYAGLADCYIVGHLGIPKQEAHARAETAALRALQLDDTLAEAHTSLAIIRSIAWDWPNAEQEYRRAIKLDPNYAVAHEWYALYLESMGRLEESLAEILSAQELDPRSLTINTAVGRILYHSRKYTEAIAQYRKTLDLDPNSLWPRWRLGQALAQKGMAEESFAEFQQARKLLGEAPGLDPIAVRLGQAYAVTGRRSEAMKILLRWRRGEASEPISRYDVAALSAVLGENEEAFALLDQAYAERDTQLISLKVDPRFDGLRSDPRCPDLLRRIGLAP